jgi:hypothetical protein
MAEILEPVQRPPQGQQRLREHSGGRFSLQFDRSAHLNQAVQSDPKAREALDKVEKSLTDAGHRSGQLLEKTRP